MLCGERVIGKQHGAFRILGFHNAAQFAPFYNNESRQHILAKVGIPFRPLSLNQESSLNVSAVTMRYNKSNDTLL